MSVASVRVAALFVDPKGVYAGLPDVDVWDEERDARLYDGPWPVVAHPPCNRWSRLSAGRRRGQDGGCFAAALAAVREFGGVLEHPAISQAWPAFGLPRPTGSGWVRAFDDPGWVCEVDQYLHRECRRISRGIDAPALTCGVGRAHGHRRRSAICFSAWPVASVRRSQHECREAT